VEPQGLSRNVPSPAGQNGWTTLNVQTGTTNQSSRVVSTNGLGGGSTWAVQLKDDWNGGGIFQLKNSFTDQDDCAEMDK
jgi:hypothetical protein